MIDSIVVISVAVDAVHVVSVPHIFYFGACGAIFRLEGGRPTFAC